MSLSPFHDHYPLIMKCLERPNNPLSRVGKAGTPVDNLTQNSGCIVDGKSVAQKIKGNNKLLYGISGSF